MSLPSSILRISPASPCELSFTDNGKGERLQMLTGAVKNKVLMNTLAGGADNSIFRSEDKWKDPLPCPPCAVQQRACRVVGLSNSAESDHPMDPTMGFTRTKTENPEDEGHRASAGTERSSPGFNKNSPACIGDSSSLSSLTSATGGACCRPGIPRCDARVMPKAALRPSSSTATSVFISNSSRRGTWVELTTRNPDPMHNTVDRSAVGITSAQRDWTSWAVSITPQAAVCMGKGTTPASELAGSPPLCFRTLIHRAGRHTSGKVTGSPPGGTTTSPRFRPLRLS
mmetsp:Transcript_48978/g.110954  ORF Transcript_48978/g.110954 Transcript_48978/m.110954 type:complete len:285 (+) Transcript_48978:391-1245(+)